ncbi:MAG: pyridoxal phosphate-dependent aminotransferase [Syntrophales bacterium]|jgi:aspartate/methionine/tyrosine aminotransferase|nr:pyridoxal phosphate-dependent aminotransferase [Syntrophales bacterium]MDD4339888.1 pyridoxal phosphate-dependent aminotransferase [Syntrophales bacterium]HOG07495.1 pyridoxal phosphate-dependent aminotransferase [Syntrophales bacterium]HOS76767.1 pyridoxal phosphate-dependent aminotransferase [Syntrophales bacterium]HPB69436.1 pyridoxal phosphate-dependent aminotransferase [Syntrophales bacterium]
MRFDIAKSGSGLTYEIRNIVAVANKLKSYGREVVWENIGDPINKGEKIPAWMKEVLVKILEEDRSYGYSPTKGMNETREYLADKVNRRGKVQISPEDIIFFNGLGDAIARAYSSIRIDARVILPEPTYSTHLLAEVLHASFPPNTYRMNPYSGWCPDIRELELKVKSHHAIVGILVINPDNPTGFVYPEENLRQIVQIAKEHDLFLVFDETYRNIVYNGKQTVPLSDIIEDVPGISMKGISKEFPWPGSRCGWIEVYNADKDETFSRYIGAILSQKMSEVCSTTLPQIAIPRIMEHAEYDRYLNERVRHYEKLSNIAYDILSDVPCLIVNRTNGAFYMTAVFNEAILNNRQALPIENDEIRQFIEKLVHDKIEPDKRFVYYLLGATGICVVPLTSFFTALPGFRMTLLDKDEKEFEQVVRTIAESVTRYINSAT